MFSKDRAAVFDLARVRGYMTYAIGEVLLIVVGILIAIQLDAAQQYRSERAQERQYIENLIEDLRYDIERSDSWFRRFDAKVGGLQAAKDYYFEGTLPDDPSDFLTRVGMGGAGSRGQVVPLTATFEELISTGGLGVILDDDIKSGILDFYTRKEFIEVYADNLRSEFATFTNSGRPYGPDGDLAHDPRDIEVALARMRTPEFLALVNQELTFAYSINARMNVFVQDAEVLIAQLEDYLAAE